MLAEPPVIDHLLQAQGLDPTLRRDCLAGLFAALGQSLRSADRRTVIKLDAWATRQMSLLLDAAGYPPWAFIFREPPAVVASELRMPGLVGAAGLLAPAMFGMTLDEALAMDQATYLRDRVCVSGVGRADATGRGGVSDRSRPPARRHRPGAVTTSACP